jgi:hypothetical protein
MSDQFEKNLRDHLRHEAEGTREFPRRLRGRIRDGIAPRRRGNLVPQLALSGALVVVAALVLLARPQVIANDVRSAWTQLVGTPAPSTTPQPFVCQDQSGGAAGITTQLTAVRIASHESSGYDRIVFDFSNGIPSYDVSRQNTATFVGDPSGQSLPLDGSAGLKLVLRDTDVASGVITDSRPGLASVQEVRQVGNFERVVTYGIGITAPQCVRVLSLTTPSRLVIDVATVPSASTTAAPTPAPVSPEATNGTALPPFSCQDQSGGMAAPTPMQLTAVRVAHQSAGYDRIVFEFAASPGTTTTLPSYTVSRQASSQFVKDPSGIEVTLQGSGGLRIVFHGATGNGSYAGSQDVKAGLPAIREVAQIGDFESVMSWGVGLTQSSCIRAFPLTSPTRLVIDVQTP